MNMDDTKKNSFNFPSELEKIQMSVGQKAYYEILEIDRTVNKMIKVNDLETRLLGITGIVFKSSIEYFKNSFQKSTQP